MFPPDELTSERPLLWSTGRGTDVWALFVACATGDTAAAGRLLDRDPSLVRAHYGYQTPLAFAVRENRLEVARLLLARDPGRAGLRFHSLIETARDRGHAEMERLLAEAVPGASARGEPVAEAIRAGDLALVRRLLDDDPTLLQAGDAHGNQPIHWAVLARRIAIIDELLARGADLDAPRRDHSRPIHLVRGDYDFRAWAMDLPATPEAVLAHLVAKGAAVDINTAAYTGDLATVRRLIAAEPALASRCSPYVGYYLGAGTPLRNAAARGHLDVVRFLLENGADPNTPEEGIAPRGHALYAAVYSGHYEVAKLLLEHGAFPSPPVESSADALSIAHSRGDARMVELLCAYGSARSVELLAYYGDLETAAAVFAADPALADDPNALGTAAGNGHEAFVRLMLRTAPGLARRASTGGRTRAIIDLLVAHGMDPDRPDWLGATPLHRAAGDGNVLAAGALLDQGAGLGARDEEFCSTPLGWAARRGQERMVAFLLRRGAAPAHPDDPPWATPLAWATRRGHVAVAEVLRRAADGTLPPAPSLAQADRLAADLVAAFTGGDADALRRIADETGRRFDAPTLRAAVREHLGRRPEHGDDLGLGDARRLVAQWHGSADWDALTRAAAP